MRPPPRGSSSIRRLRRTGPVPPVWRPAASPAPPTTRGRRSTGWGRPRQRAKVHNLAETRRAGELRELPSRRLPRERLQPGRRGQRDPLEPTGADGRRVARRPQGDRLLVGLLGPAVGDAEDQATLARRLARHAPAVRAADEVEEMTRE